MEKLRVAIDNEFEYLGHSLSDIGFKNAVKRQMKTERAKMKGWFMSGKTQCPVFIELDNGRDYVSIGRRPRQNKRRR